MFQKLKIKTELILPLSILVSIIMVLSVTLIYTQYTKSVSLTNLQNAISLSTKISQFVHSTQKERGMTSGFLASKGLKFKQELIQQRVITDTRVKELYKYFNLVNNQHITQLLYIALKNIQKLNLLRQNVDKFKVSVEDSIKFYSNMNDEFLNIIGNTLKISKLPNITQDILAYSSFLFAKENVGIERAVGTAILAQKTPNTNLKVSFINLIAIEKLYTKLFLKYASTSIKKYYYHIYKGKDIDEVSRITNIISYKNTIQSYKVEPEYWFKQITSKINKLKHIDDYLQKETLLNIKLELENTYKLFAGFVFLGILSIFIFFSMIISIIRMMQNKQRLQDLIDKYIISSSTDLKGKILEVSDAFCNISGYTREELLNKPHNIIRHPDMPKEAFKELWETIKQGKNWDGKVKNLKKNGDYYWVYAHIEPLFNKRGEIEGYVAVRLDITDSINLKEELIRSKEKDKTLFHQSKMAQMGEMLSMIAHQWRQPLSAISATSGSITLKARRGKLDEDTIMRLSKDITEYTKYLSSTIDDFRNFFKENKQKELITLKHIVEITLDIIKTSLVNTNIKVVTNLKSEKQILTYSNELRQVVLNIIKNAQDVLKEKNIQNPTIKIETDDTSITISDNAGGVPEDIMDKIFEPYFSTKTKKDGTGLGLYMSKSIIEDHCGGKLSVHNDNNGAVFIIKLNKIK